MKKSEKKVQNVTKREVNDSKAANSGRVVKTELYMMLVQLKGARECATLYRQETPNAWGIYDRLEAAVSKINDAMNDTASAIGWDVMEGIERQEAAVTAP